MNIGFEIKFHYPDYRTASEVALATVPDGSTPDIVVYSARKLNLINEVAKQTEAPLLTIEIQSPSQTNNEMVEKAHRYLAFGVQSSWIVFPAMKAIAVYTSPDNYLFFHDTDTLKDPNLTIEIDLQKIFI